MKTFLLPEPAPVREPDRKLLSDIHEYGLHVVHVLPEAGTPGWSFSVGLFRTRSSPEVLVFGLPQPVAHHVVNELGRRAADGPLEAGQVHSELLEGFDCVLTSVLPEWFDPFLGYALWYYRHRPFPVLQCVWPDRNARFPWHADFFDGWRWAQPLLYLSDPKEACAEALLASMKRGPAV